MQHSKRRHTSTKSCPAVVQQSAFSHNQAEEEEAAIGRMEAMIDETIAMLEGQQQGVGVFCVCKSTCACKEQCAVAARHTECACACYEAFWPNVRREKPGKFTLLSLFAFHPLTSFTSGRAAQAQAAHEERPYSRGSIQASLQAPPQADTNHASLSTEGTWGASRAALWSRLPPPGPPTPSPKPTASKG